ncbi:Twitchin isoform X21 [Aphelenchoides bicaudatus]|nr:Twitchin isoform X21 [Aphelenchoides bicaudatus]
MDKEATLKPKIQKRKIDEDEPTERKIYKRQGLSIASTSDENVNETENSPVLPVVVSKEVREEENGCVIIETKFKGTSTTDVFIYLNGKQYDGGSARCVPEVTELKDLGLYMVRITLKNVTVQDSGKYTILLVDNKYREIVDYTVKIDRSFERVWLTEPAACVQLDDGTMRMRFGVRSTVNNNFSTKWLHNNEEIPQSQFTRRYTQKVNKLNDSNNFEIYLDIKQPLLKINAGQYHCQVQSKQNTLRALFNIKLDDQKPVIEKDPTIELEDDSKTLVLTVEYKSKQNVIAQWRHERNGIFIDDGKDDIFEINTRPLDVPTTFVTQLKVKNFDPQTSSGLYSCELNNEWGLMVAEMNVE